MIDKFVRKWYSIGGIIRENTLYVNNLKFRLNFRFFVGKEKI